MTKEDTFAEVARDILEYVQRDLGHFDGAFYSAEDADSLPLETSTEKLGGSSVRAKKSKASGH
jgi:uncharacterized protein YyaL (SSP411 family)